MWMSTSRSLTAYSSQWDICHCPSGIQTTRTPLTVDSFNSHQFLREGAFGKVYLASHRASNQQLAIKMVNKRPFIKSNDPEDIFMNRQVLKTLRKGPFITQLFGTFQSENSCSTDGRRPGVHPLQGHHPPRHQAGKCPLGWSRKYKDCRLRCCSTTPQQQ
ncbi:protein kinase C theta type-like [Hyperolius riggenbachi]|uniref:protein kinase C theta type-like n=1 Tax=Hyperolius riggenbachi TaxID=752182 RepID=UPI0035A2B517